MDVKFQSAASRDVQGNVYRIVENKAPIHIPDSQDVDSVRDL
jgi:hypothetical protein